MSGKCAETCTLVKRDGPGKNKGKSKKTDPNQNTDANEKPDSSKKTDPKPETGPQTKKEKAKNVLKGFSKKKTDAKTESDSKAESDSKSESDSKTASDSEAKSESKSDPKTTSKLPVLGGPKGRSNKKPKQVDATDVAKPPPKPHEQKRPCANLKTEKHVCKPVVCKPPKPPKKEKVEEYDPCKYKSPAPCEEAYKRAQIPRNYPPETSLIYKDKLSKRPDYFDRSKPQPKPQPIQQPKPQKGQKKKKVSKFAAAMQKAEVSLNKAISCFYKAVEKEEEKKDIGELVNKGGVCNMDPLCNLECMFGPSEEKEEKEPELIKKGWVFSNEGALYETTSYSLPCETEEDRILARKIVEEIQPAFGEQKKVKKKKRKAPVMMEFTGPVRIMVMDKEGFLSSYTAKRVHASCVQFSYILVGAVIMLIYYFTLLYKTHFSMNAHIICFPAAFQLCLPISFLVRSKYSINGYYLNNWHRQISALVFQAIGLIYAGIGVFFFEYYEEYYFLNMRFSTDHALWGMAASFLALTGFLLHITFLVLLGQDRGHLIDCYINLLNILAISAGYYSFVTGLLKYTFLKFLPYRHWHYYVISIGAIFPFIAVIRPILDCLFYIFNCLKNFVKFAIFVQSGLKPNRYCTPRKIEC